MKEPKTKEIDIRFLYGDGDVMKNKKYLKDRNKLFRKNGNGWWWSYHNNKIQNRRKK
tara:strand:- start:52 stop:222 length:171 start_codon:yes stop_codon:yes gene_type:complete